MVAIQPPREFVCQKTVKLLRIGAKHVLNLNGCIPMLEQALNEYWKTVVDTIQDGLMVVDKEGTIISVNRALETITRYSRKELIGKQCPILQCDICEIARDEKGEHWCILFRTGSFNMRKGTLIRKDGTSAHVMKNASLLRDANGNVMGAVETVTDVTEIIEKDTQIEAFRRELRSEDGFQGILGVCAKMQSVFELVSNAAFSDAPVLILGESGTGKDLVAKAIHTISQRRQKPFVKVSCAALTESLLESELFGHVKGAYTGAYRSRKGRFQAAAGGSIFLDEIGDLPLSTQVKLLRVLEESIVERVGDNMPIHVDVRVISATNKNLKELVIKGAFRDDLFYRVHVIPIFLPPLRERPEDIPLLAESFFRKIKLKSGSKAKGISNEVMRIFMEYPWPGNVRELKSAFEYAIVCCRQSLIRPDHLPPRFHQAKKVGSLQRKASPNLEEMKRRQLINALELAGGNRSKAARILGVSRVTVWNRMRRLGVNINKHVHG
jgi:two-component system response regulator HydG